MCIYEMSAFPDIFLRGNKKKKMSMSPTGPVGRILPTLSAVGDMSATCRRHAQLSFCARIRIFFDGFTIHYCTFSPTFLIISEE